MSETITIGTQDFEKLRKGQNFYIDKTSFIKEWWEAGDDVTLITRPRRFGKTLNMSMVEEFFSIQYENRGDLFEGLSIWKEEKYRELQGTYPVIGISFANIKEENYTDTKHRINQLISNLYSNFWFLLDSPHLKDHEKKYIKDVTEQELDLPDTVLTMSLHKLAGFLFNHYGKRVIILLDEYDTPIQEAYVHGYWDELVHFMRSFFNATFKTNPYLERAIMTGITRVSRESIFSDLNNPKVITTTSDEYATSFGFTENEVFQALENFGYGDKEEDVKKWYDGFVFGQQTDIYNPWSIINFLDTGKFAPYWANTSSNRLIGKLIQSGSQNVKMIMEDLLQGNTFYTEVDEQIVFDQIDRKESAIWSLLLASGYLKVDSFTFQERRNRYLYGLKLTNLEVQMMFEDLVKGWFEETEADYNGFIKALLQDDIDAMNEYMNDVAAQVFSSFDTGKNPSQKQKPERFYHGFVLGLLVELRDRYLVTSNRESGFGRYDVILEPLEDGLDAIILEFKVRKCKREATLADTVNVALQQIEEKGYATDLIAKGIPENKIRKYGFAFEGKHVLIG